MPAHGLLVPRPDGFLVRQQIRVPQVSILRPGKSRIHAVTALVPLFPWSQIRFVPCSRFPVPCSLLLESFPHALPRGFEILWENAGFGYGGHEIGVADPAGHRMHMQVAGDPCPRGLAEIQAEVEAVGMI